MRAGGPPGRPVRRSTSSTRGRTTRSAWARTARPTSRSSTWRRCAPCPGCASSARPTPTSARRPGAWRSTAKGPVALILSRQGIPVLAETAARAADGVARGGLRPAAGARAARPRSSSSAPAARSTCAWPPPTSWQRGGHARARGLASRAGSGSPTRTTPTARRCCRPGVPTLAVEAAASFGWDRYADDSVSIDTFGASAPGDGGARPLRLHARERGRACPRPRGRHGVTSRSPTTPVRAPAVQHGIAARHRAARHR